MSAKHLFKDYLTFSKKDRVFTVFVVLVIAASFLLPRYLAPKPQPLALKQDSALKTAIDTLAVREAKNPSYRRQEDFSAFRYERSPSKGYTEEKLFPFDPNTISFEDWRRLGLNERTSKTIINYVSKGGKFYKPEDLQKIWGLPPGFYERVKDYVNITSVQRRTYPQYPQYSDNRPRYERPERKPLVVNINEADTSAFIALPGIGSRLSARIIAFRQKLGGFYAVDQVAETYGLPDSTFQLIRGMLQVNESAVQKINVNTATKDELRAHPYIRWNLANAIVEYRNQHGAFKSLEELKNIVLIDNATYQKISHYLVL